MNDAIIRYLVIGTVAVSTYLMRFLPMRFRDRIDLEKFKGFLNNSSTAIISALFVTSFMPSTGNITTFFVAILTLLGVLIFYKLWKNLGLSILIGVLIHFLLSSILSKV